MRRLLLIAATGIIVLLVAAQLLLPGIAADRLRAQLAGHGHVLAVEVHAFPAIELLWHQADRVSVRMADYRASGTSLGSSIGQIADVERLDASAARLTAGLLTVRDATLRKRGRSVTASARVSESDLRASIPLLDNVRLLASGGGQLTLRGSATLLGVTATADAAVAPVDGRLLLQPQVPFGGLVTITLFDQPRLRVEDVSAAPSADGFTVAARARTN